MYQTYWQLAARPFSAAVEPDRYYPSEPHQGALLKLRYALQSQGGGAVLAGPAGSGKTLLVEILRQQLAEECGAFVHVVYPQLTPAELLAYLAEELETETGKEPNVGQSALRRVENALRSIHLAGKQTIVVVDEAQVLEATGGWESLRLLLNFAEAGQPLATLLLVGQMPLVTALDRAFQLDERLGLRCLLRALTADETAAYIEHRLRSAGSRQTIFSSAALSAIHQLSHGLPRRINRLGDLCLLVGFAEELSAIDASTVEAVAAELCALPA